jgi:5-methylthioadenosine/S-adenosylhomocysteine deaminase
MPERVLVGTAMETGRAVLVRDGRIAAVGDSRELTAAHPDAMPVPLKDQLLVAGGVNGHNHSFQILMRGLGEDDDFFGWRSQVLYPISERLSRSEIRDGALLAFADMLESGITTVADFFYLNDGGIDHALAVADAARTVGIRLVLARCFYDWEGAPARYRETPAQARRNTRALYDAVGADPLVTVQVAPHSPHGASAAMIEAAVASAEELAVPLHIHCAEGRYEREACLNHYGLTPVGWLRERGALTARTVLIHAVWVDDRDLDLIAEAGASVIHNPSSNMILGDGIAPVPAMLARGVTVGLGTDGGCTNDRSSLFDEMRTAALLQKVAAQDGKALDADSSWLMGTEGGARALQIEAGRMEPGQLADLVSLDLNDWSLLPGPPTVRHLVYALSPRAVRSVFVNGREVVRDGRVVFPGAAELRVRSRSWQTAAVRPAAD